MAAEALEEASKAEEEATKVEAVSKAEAAAIKEEEATNRKDPLETNTTNITNRMLVQVHQAPLEQTATPEIAMLQVPQDHHRQDTGSGTQIIDNQIGLYRMIAC